ncbi:hypothetical protein AB0L53_34710 [Nonomuraea sp. NPDC052129]|uniref:hypothetical protein n=1 Tax=Nonomuraea sp. NPDC052129 TaxID=3154651 RepID=UPI00343F7C0A
MTADGHSPVLLPALPIAAATGDVIGLYGLTDSLFGAVRAAMSDWALAGVIEPVSRPIDPDVAERMMKDLEAGFYQELAPEEPDEADDDPTAVRGLSAEQFLQTILRPALTAVRDSAVVCRTPLGVYGVRRLLVAHGWDVAAP